MGNITSSSSSSSIIKPKLLLRLRIRNQLIICSHRNNYPYYPVNTLKSHTYIPQHPTLSTRVLHLRGLFEKGLKSYANPGFLMLLATQNKNITIKILKSHDQLCSEGLEVMRNICTEWKNKFECWRFIYQTICISIR